MPLKQTINDLENISLEKPNKVLTMYLNTDRKSSEMQGGEWKIYLKNGLKRLQEYIKNSGADEELKNYKKIRKKVEKVIAEHETSLLRGIVLFASADESIWYMEVVQLPVETAFYWETEPILDQLQDLEQNYPYAGVVLLQQDEAAILETELGELIDKHHFSLDSDMSDWRDHQGPHETQAGMSGGVKKDEVKDRFEENKQRWYKSLASKVEKKAGKNNWQAVYLVGEKSEVETLKPSFNKSIDKVIPKNLLNQNDYDILSEVL